MSRAAAPHHPAERLVCVAFADGLSKVTRSWLPFWSLPRADYQSLIVGAGSDISTRTVANDEDSFLDIHTEQAERFGIYQHRVRR